MRFFLVLFSTTLAAQWTPELALQVKTVTGAVPSPDGRHVVYAQTRAVMEPDRSEMVTQIWVAAADGSVRYALTNGEKSATGPRWSPDGKFVFFSSERSGKPQLYRIPVDGGEAEMLTDWKGEIGEYVPSPDGKHLAFAAFEERAEEEKAKKEKRDWKVVDAAPHNHGIWLIALAGEAPRKPRKLVAPDRHVVSLAWSPDSRKIAFAHVTRPEADYWPTSDISEVEVESGTTVRIAAGRAAEQNPRYSPDGRYLAFQQSEDPPRWMFAHRIVLHSRSSGEQRVLPKTFDEQPVVVGWAKDSTRMFFTETRKTRGTVYAMPVDGPPAVLYEPAAGTTASVAANEAGTHLAFTQESPAEAPEAFVMNAAERKPIRVSAANVGLPKHAIGETRTLAWKSKDGMAVEGLLTLPADYEKGKRYPLLLNIHGGPAGVFVESFLGRYGIYPLAALSGKGYAILRVNPRGSSGYGREFRFANIQDWGGRDYEDLMTGVDRLIADGIADPDHLGVMGWSYGGFMSSWIVTQTTRFKAAAIGAPVTNLWSFTGTADIPGFLPDYFGGEPHQVFERFRTHSPISFVKSAVTPSLILHGEADLRVPLAQGQEFYRALKRQGVTAKLVTYPRMPHGPVEPKFMLDIMQRHMEWMEKYVR